MDKKSISRFEFFKEIKEDIKQTAKEFFIPIIADDVDKVDNIIEDIIGIEWYPLGNIDPEYIYGIKDYYINNRNIAVFYTDEDLKAVEKKCPRCENLLNWIPYDKKFKCFQCENEYYIDDEKKNPKLNYYSLRRQDDIWLIGISKII